jgi:ABC-type polysaccharide/polyol phosphate transport system ATPase subunit
MGFILASPYKARALDGQHRFRLGDVEFIEIVDKANTLAFASHQTGVIRSLGNQVVWLEHGTIEQFGPSELVIQAF